MNNPTKKIALITGGSSGLGLAMAEYLADDGYTPILLARNQDKIDSALASIHEKGHKAFGFSCDVTDTDALHNTAKTIQARLQKIDFLILNAGVVHTNLMDDFDNLEDLESDINIDLWGTILPTKIFLPHLATNAKILFISSGFGLIGVAGYAPYCAAKAGMINFAAALRREVLHTPISVYVACPSDIDTPQFREEQASMPDWMRIAGARGKVMASNTAATKILKKCSGKRFLILINFELYLLQFLTRILPERLTRSILDRMFPRPTNKMASARTPNLGQP